MKQQIKYKLAQKLNYWFFHFPESLRPKLTESKSEDIFKSILVKHNTKFKQQVKIGHYRVDFLVGNQIFEIDGFHHQWTKYKDKKRDKYLVKKGYKIIRIDADKLYSNFNFINDWVISKIG